MRQPWIPQYFWSACGAIKSAQKLDGVPFQHLKVTFFYAAASRSEGKTLVVSLVHEWSSCVCLALEDTIRITQRFSYFSTDNPLCASLILGHSWTTHCFTCSFSCAALSSKCVWLCHFAVHCSPLQLPLQWSVDTEAALLPPGGWANLWRNWATLQAVSAGNRGACTSRCQEASCITRLHQSYASQVENLKSVPSATHLVIVAFSLAVVNTYVRGLLSAYTTKFIAKTSS